MLSLEGCKVWPVVQNRYLHLFTTPWAKAQKAAWGWVMTTDESSSSSVYQLSTLTCTNTSIMRSGPMKDPRYTFSSVVTWTTLSLKISLAELRDTPWQLARFWMDSQSIIGWSCNYTTWESDGLMSGVKIQTFRPNPGSSSVNYDLQYTAGWLHTCKKAGEGGYFWREMMVIPQVVIKNI